MTVSFEFLAGFTCCSMVVFLYLLHELVEVGTALVLLLRESLEELWYSMRDGDERGPRGFRGGQREGGLKG